MQSGSFFPSNGLGLSTGSRKVYALCSGLRVWGLGFGAVRLMLRIRA